MNEHRLRVGQQLAAIRKEKNLTAEEMAERLGTCFQTIYKIEGGKWSVGLDILERYANALGAEVYIRKVAE